MGKGVTIMTTNKKYTVTQIKALCREHNMVFVDVKYVNNTYKHRWFCNVHQQEHVQMLDKIRKGGLKCCGNERLVAANKRELAHHECDNDITLISTNYQNSAQPLKWECNRHKQPFTRSLQRIRLNSIPDCCKNDAKLEEIKKIIDPLNYELVDSVYSGTTHTWHCKTHNKTFTSRTRYQNFKNGALLRCCAGKKRSGKNHPNYNHNVTDDQRVKDRRSHEYTQWRQSVIKRDLLICQVCSEGDVKIVAHHIDGYLANPYLRYETSNGVTMCVSCHKKFHSIFGNGNNTRDQYDEFYESQSVQ